MSRASASRNPSNTRARNATLEVFGERDLFLQELLALRQVEIGLDVLGGLFDFRIGEMPDALLEQRVAEGLGRLLNDSGR